MSIVGRIPVRVAAMRVPRMIQLGIILDFWLREVSNWLFHLYMLRKYAEWKDALIEISMGVGIGTHVHPTATSNCITEIIPMYSHADLDPSCQSRLIRRLQLLRSSTQVCIHHNA